MPLRGALQDPSNWKAFLLTLQSPLRRLHLEPTFSVNEAAETLLSGERQLFPPRPRAPGSGTRRPAALLRHRHSHQNTWAPKHREQRRRGTQQKKKERKSEEQLPAWPPSEAPIEVGLLEQRPLGLAEHLPGRRRDFVASAQLELLAVRGVWGPRGGRMPFRERTQHWS